MFDCHSDQTHCLIKTLYGPIRAAALRASGKIQWKPCPITNSEDDNLKIWLVPQSWSTAASSDVKAGEVKNDSKGTLEDVRALNMMSHVNVGEELLTDEAPVEPQVKKEPAEEKTPEETDKEDMDSFVANIAATARRFIKASLQLILHEF